MTTHALEAIFPELLDIEALVIRDFYHRYTVDEHTLVAIETVLGLRGKDDRTKIRSGIWPRKPKNWIC